MLLLRTSATNVVRTAASRRQNHLCRGIFTGASLNTIGCAKLVSSVGLVVFILCWSREGANTVGHLSSKPAMKPCCLKDGSAWYIELTWPDGRVERSEERRVGKECRSRWWQEHDKKKRYRRGEMKGNRE